MQRQVYMKTEDADICKSSTLRTSIAIFCKIIILLMTIQRIPIGEATVYRLREGDTCLTKGEMGICRTWGDCAIIKTLIERKEYSTETVERCGFNIIEELICCPVVRIESITEAPKLNTKIRESPNAITNRIVPPTEIASSSLGHSDVIVAESNDPNEKTKKLNQFILESFQKHIIKDIKRDEGIVIAATTNEGAPTIDQNTSMYSTFQDSPQNVVVNGTAYGKAKSLLQSNERPAETACRLIQTAFKRTGVTSNISRNTSAVLGEFPHTVSIGYGRNGQGPYDFLCAGSLIDSRYVVTAAHCVVSGNPLASIVRMGVVNVSDPVEMSRAVEIRIKKIHLHNEYSRRRLYNDIAILELERPVEYNEYIYPACLYTDEADLQPEANLWATGWAQTNRWSRGYSKVLLKSSVSVTPLRKCNTTYVEYGLPRSIRQGVKRTQLCATNVDQLTEACQGMPGGPLSVFEDGPLKSHRLVGVVSNGCHPALPTLYTRVSMFLDFIEQIVWYNGVDVRK